MAGAQPQTGALYNGSGTCNPQFPAGSSKYTLVSGTSQAAPETTGFAALLHEWYRVHEGGGTRYPSPAMTKALMVNTATDIAGGDDGAGGVNGAIPTQVQGWGRINLGRVLDGTTRQTIDQSTTITATGSSRTYYHTVSGAARPLKVTLAWTDPVGPTTGNAFVNDLDLEIEAAGGLYKGNVLSGGVSAPGGTADPRNNVENVFLPAGLTGSVQGPGRRAQHRGRRRPRQRGHDRPGLRAAGLQRRAGSGHTGSVQGDQPDGHQGRRRRRLRRAGRAVQRRAGRAAT